VAIPLRENVPEFLPLTPWNLAGKPATIRLHKTTSSYWNLKHLGSMTTTIIIPQFDLQNCPRSVPNRV